MASEYLAERDPVDTMTQLHMIRWLLAAWDEVQPQSISRCFIKSQLFGMYEGPSCQLTAYFEAEVLKATRETVQDLQRAWQIRNVIDIDRFTELEEESVADSDSPILQ